MAVVFFCRQFTDPCEYSFGIGINDEGWYAYRVKQDGISRFWVHPIYGQKFFSQEHGIS